MPDQRSSRSRMSAPRSGRGTRHRTTAPRAPQQPVRSALELALDAAAEAAAASVPTGPPASFASLGLDPKLVSALRRRGVEAPFAIQERAIPDALAGRDVLGRGQTGSGKTLAFGLPLLSRLVGGQRLPRQPRGLVLVPTRELAQQVHDALAPLAQSLDIRLMAIYGGASMGRQIDALRRATDLVIATPGRLEDLIAQGECRLDRVEVTVLDEADHMADLGFLPVVTRILDQTPRGGQRLLFSATLDRGVDRLVTSYLHDPAVHAVAAAASPVDTMDHVVFAVAADAKVAVATEIAGRTGRTLFFVRTKHGADRLALQLRKGGVPAGAIHGNLNQNARRRALAAFTDGSARVLVATDVAARGIHVDDVDLVVHYDPPADHKDYLHRSGRTARAGARGTVLSLLLSEQAAEGQQLRQRAGIVANAVAVTPGHPAVGQLVAAGSQGPAVTGPASSVPPVPPARPQQQRPRNGNRRATRPAVQRSA